MSKATPRRGLMAKRRRFISISDLARTNGTFFQQGMDASGKGGIVRHVFSQGDPETFGGKPGALASEDHAFYGAQ